MLQISLRHPVLLLAAAVPVALFLLQVFFAARKRGKAPLSAFDWMPDQRREPVIAQRFTWVLRLVAMLCLVLLLSGFHGRRCEYVAAQEPSALVVVLDISSSMTSEDFAPRNRLEEAKRHLSEFVSSHPEVELGLIQFAAVPKLLAPVTSDHQAILTALEQVRPAEYGEDGTAIGSAIASALNRLRGGNWNRRMILLITDGVNNRGAIAPLDAARLARAFGMPIFAIGIGTDAESRFWIPTAQGELAQLEARIEIDDRALEMLAQETGGHYQRVRNSQELRQALVDLVVVKDRAAVKPVVRTDPRLPRTLAAIAVVCLCLEFTIAYFLYPELPG
jgi:Ca-activated chloride channel family protein